MPARAARGPVTRSWLSVQRELGAPMRVRNFVIGTAGGTTLGNAPLTIWNNYPNGIFGFNVGATLDVGANQAPGKYTGTWSITINYV